MREGGGIHSIAPSGASCRVGGKVRRFDAPGAAACRWHLRALASALCNVLHVYRQRYPGMHPFFIDRERRRREARICEGADGNGNSVYVTFRDEVDRGAASRAERESGPSAFVADQDMFRAGSADFDCLARKPGLRRKDAPASALAGEAMADPYPDRISRDSGREPAATARRDSKCHDNVGKSSSNAWLIPTDCNAMPCERKQPFPA